MVYVHQMLRPLDKVNYEDQVLSPTCTTLETNTCTFLISFRMKQTVVKMTVSLIFQF